MHAQSAISFLMSNFDCLPLGDGFGLQRVHGNGVLLYWSCCAVDIKQSNNNRVLHTVFVDAW